MQPLGVNLSWTNTFIFSHRLNRQKGGISFKVLRRLSYSILSNTKDNCHTGELGNRGQALLEGRRTSTPSAQAYIPIPNYVSWPIDRSIDKEFEIPGSVKTRKKRLLIGI